jgi:sulfate adenylyltransferase
VAWTIPIVLDLPTDSHPDLKAGDRMALVHEGKPIAALDVNEVYGYDAEQYAKVVFGTNDASHPGVEKVNGMGERLVGGPIMLADDLPSPFPQYTLWPIETRVLFKEKGWRTVVAFQTRNPPHLGHEYVQKSALTFTDGLFVNPIIGKKKSGDFTDEIITRTYQELIDKYYLRDRAVMGVLQSEMRYGGPKEAILHAIMRKNFGCTHFIVGRDHAGVGSFYSPYAAQDIFSEFPDLGIVPLFFKSFFYCKRCGSIANEKICPHEGDDIINFSGSKIRGRLVEGLPPGEDMMRPEVSEIILEADSPFVE